MLFLKLHNVYFRKELNGEQYEASTGWGGRVAAWLEDRKAPSLSFGQLRQLGVQNCSIITIVSFKIWHYMNY